jgi:hypothetical protein
VRRAPPAPNGHNRGMDLLRPTRKASARIQGLKRGGSRFSKLGGWRTNLRVLAGVTSWPGASRKVRPSRSPPGRAAPGPPGLPVGNGDVQELDLRRVEAIAVVFVPLGVNPHPEGVLTL